MSGRVTPVTTGMAADGSTQGTTAAVWASHSAARTAADIAASTVVRPPSRAASVPRGQPPVHPPQSAEGPPSAGAPAPEAPLSQHATASILAAAVHVLQNSTNSSELRQQFLRVLAAPGPVSGSSHAHTATPGGRGAPHQLVSGLAAGRATADSLNSELSPAWDDGAVDGAADAPVDDVAGATSRTLHTSPPSGRAFLPVSQHTQRLPGAFGSSGGSPPHASPVTAASPRAPILAAPAASYASMLSSPSDPRAREAQLAFDDISLLDGTLSVMTTIPTGGLLMNSPLGEFVTKGRRCNAQYPSARPRLVGRVSDGAWAQLRTEESFIAVLASALPEFDFAESTTPPPELPNDALLSALVSVLTGCAGSFEVAFTQALKGFQQLSPKHTRDFNIAQLESLLSIVNSLAALYPSAVTDAWGVLAQNNGRIWLDSACVQQVARALGGTSSSASAATLSLSDCKSFTASDGSASAMTIPYMVLTLKTALNRDKRISKQLTESFGAWAAPSSNGGVSFSRDDNRGSSQPRGRSAQPGSERKPRSSSNSSNKSTRSTKSSRGDKRDGAYNSDACKQCYEAQGVNKFHDAPQCWVRHPELREEFLRSRDSRDSRGTRSSSKSAPRGRDGKRDSRPRDDSQSDTRGQRNSGGGHSGGGGQRGSSRSSRSSAESSSTGGGVSRSGTKANVRRVSTVVEDDDDDAAGRDDDDEYLD